MKMAGYPTRDQSPVSSQTGWLSFRWQPKYIAAMYDQLQIIHVVRPARALEKTLDVKSPRLWQPAVEISRVAGNPKPEITGELLPTEDPPILLKLWIVHMALPKESEVDHHPQRRKECGNHTSCQKGTHILPDECRVQNAQEACSHEHHVRQEECQQPIHRILQSVAVLELDTLMNLTREHCLQERLENHKGNIRPHT